MSTNSELDNTLRDIATEYWATHNRPLLLSNLPPLIEEKLQDYKELLRGASLKGYIKGREGACGYKLIEHPMQKAKVGIIPSDIEYKFSPPPVDNPSVRKSKADPGAIISFLAELAKLPEAEVEKIDIPVSVLVKLLKS